MTIVSEALCYFWVKNTFFPLLIGKLVSRDDLNAADAYPFFK